MRDAIAAAPHKAIQWLKLFHFQSVQELLAGGQPVGVWFGTLCTHKLYASYQEWAVQRVNQFHIFHGFDLEVWFVFWCAIALWAAATTWQKDKLI